MTSDYPALLAAVLAAPDEDTPRLVLADWLDDHGEGKRAAFIRLQCRLAVLNGLPAGGCPYPITPRIDLTAADGSTVRVGELDPVPCDTPCCEVCSERSALWSREWALLDPPRDWFDVPGWRTVWNGQDRGECGVVTWVPGLRPYPANVGLEAYPVRGFVGRVWCHPDSWKEFGATILVAHPVRVVKLSATPDGPPWTDEYAPPDAEGRFRFPAWPGVAFELPEPGDGA